MEFRTSSQEATYNRIKPLLLELFGEAGAQPREDVPQWVVQSGSAIVVVGVMAWHDDTSLVSALSWVARGTDLTPDCLKYLLEQNHEFVFGAFSVDDEGDIAFSHTVLGETCGKEDLRHLVAAVAMTADSQDDTIVSRWGGTRAADR